MVVSKPESKVTSLNFGRYRRRTVGRAVVETIVSSSDSADSVVVELVRKRFGRSPNGRRTGLTGATGSSESANSADDASTSAGLAVVRSRFGRNLIDELSGRVRIVIASSSLSTTYPVETSPTSSLLLFCSPRTCDRLGKELPGTTCFLLPDDENEKELTLLPDAVWPTDATSDTTTCSSSSSVFAAVAAVVVVEEVADGPPNGRRVRLTNANGRGLETDAKNSPVALFPLEVTWILSLTLLTLELVLLRGTLEVAVVDGVPMVLVSGAVVELNPGSGNSEVVDSTSAVSSTAAGLVVNESVLSCLVSRREIVVNFLDVPINVFKLADLSVFCSSSDPTDADM